MATLTMASTTTQVRPYPAGGAWNNVAVSAKVALKSTTYGVTLRPGYQEVALLALNAWMSQGGGGTANRIAQKRANGIGLEIRESGVISSAQTGNGVSTNIVDRGGTLGPAQVAIVTTVGATPTCTYLIESSQDGTNWSAQEYAQSTTPTVKVTTTFAITTATTTTLLVSDNVPWRYLRITYSANTNVTSTATVAVG